MENAKTFEEWWAAYDPDDLCCAGDQAMARMAWEHSADVERERCAGIADGWTEHDGHENESPAVTAHFIALAIRG